MTAEACVMNRLSVALAADSAMTLSLGRGGQKIYTSSDKLFELSKIAPVGVLVYGNADFIGVPWETVIKTFREEQGEEVYPELGDYGERLLNFLGDHRLLFSKEAEERHVDRVISNLLYAVRSSVASALDREAEKRDGLSEADVIEILEASLKVYLRHVERQDSLVSLGDDARKRVRAAIGKRLPKLRAAVFGELPLNRASVRDLNRIVIETLCSAYFGPAESGLVIAGFGEEQFAPSLVHFKIEQRVLGKPRYYVASSGAVTDDNEASVHAFAQNDVVFAFMEGIDPALSDFLEESTRALFEASCEALIDLVGAVDAKMKEEVQKSWGDATKKLSSSLFEQWERRRVYQWGPIMEVTAALPKDELAGMAEALVNLTKFRRRVTPSAETVGGPIDVAVISKGDGFVWVKRKHYFPGELNPRVLARY